MNAPFTLLLAALFPGDAFAYIDPGSGMLFWQGLIAVIGGVVMLVKNPVQTIKDWIQRLRQK